MRPQMLATGLRYFLVVAQTRSLSAAAQQLHVAVSAISRQISNLEESMGCTLFERNPRGMELNEAGLRLAAFVRATSLEAERVIEEVRGNAARATRVVRVACTEGFSAGFLPPVMTGFRARCADSAVHLNVASPDEVSRQVRAGDADVAMKYCVEPEQGLLTVHHQPSPIVALVHPRHALAKSVQVDIEQVLRYPLALPYKGTTVRQAFDLACSARGTTYLPAFVGNAASLLDIAVQGGGVLLSGYLGASHLIQRGLLRAVRIDDPYLQARSLHVLVLEGRTLPEAPAAFVEHLVKGVKGAAAPVRRVARARALKPAPARRS